MHASQDNGQGLVEYALLISLIVLVVIVILSLTAQDIVGLFEYLNAVIDNTINL